MQFKHDIRPFVGVNMLFRGDVWQLPPADGGFLGDIPFELIENSRLYAPAPSISHGQSLLGGGPETGVQGVTELTLCERTSDEWLRSVQNEFRIGKLSSDSYAFLHGLPTLFPGSAIGKTAKCRSDKCKDRAAAMASCEETVSDITRHVLAKETLDMECTTCKNERAKRILVARSDNDRRLNEDKFEVAPAVCLNNDMKYEVNQLRAQAYARKRGTGLMYCPAKDTPTGDALRVRPDLPSQKVSWLNRHDREFGTCTVYCL